MQGIEEGVPGLEPDALLLPLRQPPPAGGRRGISVGQGLPAAAVAEHPEDALDDGAVGHRLGAALGRRLRLGQDAGQQLPLLIRQLGMANVDDSFAGHRHLLSRRYAPANSLPQQKLRPTSCETASNLNRPQQSRVRIMREFLSDALQICTAEFVQNIGPPVRSAVY